MQVYVITKLGLLFVYDLETATAVYRNRISPDPIFLAVGSPSTGGFYAVNRRGQVILGTVNEVTMVPFVSGQLQNLGLALAIAKRGNLPGAEALVGQQFEQLFASGAFKEAAEVAADSPKVRAGKAYMYVHSLRGKGKGVGGVGGCKHFWPC
eukprot:1150680-Pelagomonas_calceolata.AAC.3